MDRLKNVALSFKHLRNTVVKELAESSCTTFEVASITGHALASCHTILQEYWKASPEQALAAVAKREKKRKAS